MFEFLLNPNINFSRFVLSRIALIIYIIVGILLIYNYVFPLEPTTSSPICEQYFLANETYELNVYPDMIMLTQYTEVAYTSEGWPYQRIIDRWAINRSPYAVVNSQNLDPLGRYIKGRNTTLIHYNTTTFERNFGD